MPLPDAWTGKRGRDFIAGGHDDPDWGGRQRISTQRFRSGIAFAKAFIGRNPGRLPLLALLIAAANVSEVSAHGSERGFVALLPTGYYSIGSALAVAASFILLALVPSRTMDAAVSWRQRLFTLPRIPRAATSLLSFGILLLAVAAGFFSTPDPLENILPLLIWTGFWVVYILATALLGNFWPWLNPWTGPLRLIRRLSGRRLGRQPLARLPARLGYFPAIIQFFLFAWFELGALAPEDPRDLALIVMLFWLFNFAMMAVFGEAEWMRRGEPFSVYCRLIGMMSPLAVKPSRIRPGRLDVGLQLPGRNYLDHPALPPSGIVFVALTLATVSFCGFSQTFTWFGLIGINPLDFEGRSQVQVANSLGLLAAVPVLLTFYMTAVWLGCWLAGIRSASTILRLAGLFVLSLLPISVAFHASHYLIVLLVNGQYLLAAMSDPFASGLNLFGTAEDHVTTSFLTNLDGVTLIWRIQTAIVVIGHVVGIAIAHAIAVRHFSSVRQAVLSQSFLALGMVGFTVFGLWLLSTLSTG